MLLLYGFPGAGKTYFARQFCDSVQAAHVQSDRIRSELFERPRYEKHETAIVTQLMNYMTEEFLGAGVSVVYDGNLLRAAQRHTLREIARKAKATPLVVWFQIDIEFSFGRAMRRDRRRADDKYAAPMDRTTYGDIIAHMQNPANTEDYVVVSGKHTFGTQNSAVLRRLRELGLVSLADQSANTPKPGLVNLVPGTAVPGGRVDMSRRNIVIR